MHRPKCFGRSFWFFSIADEENHITSILDSSDVAAGCTPLLLRRDMSSLKQIIHTSRI